MRRSIFRFMFQVTIANYSTLVSNNNNPARFLCIIISVWTQTLPLNKVRGTWRKSRDVNLKEWNGGTLRHWQYNMIVIQNTGAIKYSVSDSVEEKGIIVKKKPPVNVPVVSARVSVWRVGNNTWRIQKQYK